MMQVILKEDVHNLGKSGDLVKVKPGYGRNFLLPQGLAVIATEGNVKEVEHQKKLIAARNAKLSKDAQAQADRLGAVEVQIERQVDERMAKTGALRVVTAIRRDIGIEILGRRRRTNENEAIMVVRAMQDLARDRGEERLGALGLPMVDQ